MILKVTDLTRTILTVAYLTKTILTVTYLTKTILTVIWPKQSLQLHTWPRQSHWHWILQLHSEPCSALSHPCNTASLFSGQNTWDRFRTVMWHGIKSYRFPLSSLNTWDRGFAQSRGMEVKITGSLFSDLKAWDGGFRQLCGMEAGFPFQV